jgi:hypothetical protein
MKSAEGLNCWNALCFVKIQWMIGDLLLNFFIKVSIAQESAQYDTMVKS